MHVRFVHSELQSLGIEYLAAALKARGHGAELIVDPSFSFLRLPALLAKRVLDYKKKLIRRILSGDPGLLAFSVTAHNFDWACSLSAELKRTSFVPIVFGGIHASSTPETVLRKSLADYVILGEGESALCDLAEGIAQGKVNLKMENLCYLRDGAFFKNPMRGLVADLDSLPLSDKDILPRWFNKGLYRIVTGRGCAGRCSYCCSPLQRRMYEGKGEFIRRRSVGNVIDELKRAKDKYGMRRVFFEDDDFTHDVAWLREFQNRYKAEIGLPCFVHAIPANIGEQTVTLLRKMMCAQVEIGVQSLNETTRKNILNRSDTQEQITAAVTLLKKNEIGCICDNIVNLPGETSGDLLKMVRFYDQFRAGKVEVLPLRYYFGAPITEKSSDPNTIHEGIRCGGYAASVCDNNEKKKILMLIGLSYIFPRSIISFLIRRNWYRFLPAADNFGHFNEIVYYLSSLFKKHRARNFVGFRADEFYKLKYLFCH